MTAAALPPPRPPPPHAASPQLDAAALLRQLHDQQERARREQEPLPPAVRAVVGSAGVGFVYGTMFGGVLAGVEGVRASPAHQRLRGAVHHIKAEVPRTAGRIALVSCLFRVASLGLTELRTAFADTSADGRERADAAAHEDMWNVLLAAPFAGAVLKLRHGPRAAMHSAFAFGSVAVVMVAFHAAESKVHGHGHGSHRVEAREVLEEVAFAQEFDDFEA